jgi:SAM-dependent MidA family methyltransferase
MSDATSILREEIRCSGPISFRRFMEVALYHPKAGYYRHRDPFGRRGDYYTAEQLQPVFGILIATRIRMLFEEMGRSSEFTVVELGAGRGEMAPAFSGFRYFPVEIGSNSWPERFSGVVFCNEFFDALPVHVVVRRGGAFREVMVDWRSDRFVRVDGEVASEELESYLEQYATSREEGDLVEVNLEALRWMEEIARRLESGFVLTIDYGYTSRELGRFPRGTLMSYRRHIADDDVLAEPGERDITAHVCFTALEEHGAQHGLNKVRFESLSQTLLAAGEADQFSAALTGSTAEEQLRRRLQLKTLLFGMGEIFRTLLQQKRGQIKTAPR